MDLKLGLEYRDVALRPEHLAASQLTADEMLEVIEAVEAVAESVKVVESHRPVSPDQNDDMILDIAINGRADALVTNNIRHFTAAGKRYGIPVILPSELLRRMREESKNGK